MIPDAVVFALGCLAFCGALNDERLLSLLGDLGFCSLVLGSFRDDDGLIGDFCYYEEV